MRVYVVLGLVWFFVGVQVVARQEPPPQTGEAYPGQEHHAKPPDGWYCSYTAKDEHHCECERVIRPGDNCEDEPDVIQCKTYCWAHGKETRDENGKVTGIESSHCLCPIKGGCSMPGHHHPKP